MAKYTVTSNQPITPSIHLLTLRSEDGHGITHLPGQYAAIHFRRFGRPAPVRCFSIVSAPEQKGVLQFAFRITGSYTARLASLREGETVYVQGPFGEFVMDEAFDRNVVFLGGGIGITPFISMARHLAATRSPIKATLLLAARSTAELPFAEELRRLESQNANFHSAFVVENVDDSMPANQIIKGRINEQLIGNLMERLPRNTTYFVCGPPKFMDSVTAILAAHGVDEDHLVVEAFGQRGFGKKHGVASPLPRAIYAFSALGILLGAGLLLGANLLSRVRAEAHSARPATLGSTTSNANNPQSDQSTSTSSDTSSSSAASSAGSSQSYTQTYQQPVSSVS